MAQCARLPIFTVVLDNGGWQAVKEVVARAHPGGEAVTAYEFQARLGGTPAAVVNKPQAEVARILKLPNVGERMAQLGMAPEGGPSKDLARTIATKIPLWTGVARANNIKAE